MHDTPSDKTHTCRTQITNCSQDASRFTEHQLLLWHEAGGDGSDGSGSTGGLFSGSPGMAAAGFVASGSQLVVPALFVGGASSAAPGIAPMASLPAGTMSLMSSAAGAGMGAGSAAGTAHSHVARLAPLSGLQPPPLQSRLAGHTAETPGEQLLLG